MASNKHHEFAKLVMAQVADLLTNYSIRQPNSFVNTSGLFPKLIKFDYLGKWSLKGPTRLIIEAGLEIAADYTYFTTGYTWIETKQRYYISNFCRYRDDLVPNEEDNFFKRRYELTMGTDGRIDVGLIRHELVHYFLPYVNRLNNLDDLVTFLHWHKPTEEEMLYPYKRHSFFYNWLTVIYLLLTEKRTLEAEACLEKVIHIFCQLDSRDPNRQKGEANFSLIDKLQNDFALTCRYTYDKHLRRIVIS